MLINGGSLNVEMPPTFAARNTYNAQPSSTEAHMIDFQRVSDSSIWNLDAVSEEGGSGISTRMSSNMGEQGRFSVLSAPTVQMTQNHM